MSIKVAITGSSGILGRSVYSKFQNEKDFIAYGFVFSRNSDSSRIKCDLTNETEIFTTLNSIRPSIIIHCAAERRPDIVSQNPQHAEILNVGSAIYISKWADENDSYVIYISSDYVFDGKSSPYDEEAIASPLNDYGIMKLQSEKAVLSINDKNIVLRLPILYGNVEYIEESAVTIIFKEVKEISKRAVMSNYEKRYPTHCDDVAQTIVNMVKFRSMDHQKLQGIFHYQSDEEMTKLDMALKMAELFSLPTKHIVAADIPNGSETTKRPYKAQMSCQKLKSLGLYHIPITFSDGITSSLKLFV